MNSSGLLIRGFGVRVPGGAPVIKALTWWFTQDQNLSHVHSGWTWDLCVLFSFRTRIMGVPDPCRPSRSVSGDHLSPANAAPASGRSASTTDPSVRCPAVSASG